MEGGASEAATRLWNFMQILPLTSDLQTIVKAVLGDSVPRTPIRLATLHLRQLG